MIITNYLNSSKSYQEKYGWIQATHVLIYTQCNRQLKGRLKGWHMKLYVMKFWLRWVPWDQRLPFQRRRDKFKK